MSSNRPSRKLSRLIAARAQWHCEYCLSPSAFSTQPFEVDHIVPLSKNGLTVPENLAFSCGCNSYKGNKTRGRDSRTGRLVPLFHPRRQRWTQHFFWSEDLLRIVGRTATGRATVDTLQLNRIELLNLRRLLRTTGEQSPSPP